MAVLFFDTSGLVKNYVAEVGTAWVQALMAPAADHDRFVAQITGAELVAAVTRRRNRGDLTPADSSAALADVQADFERDYLLV